MSNETTTSGFYLDPASVRMVDCPCCNGTGIDEQFDLPIIDEDYPHIEIRCIDDVPEVIKEVYICTHCDGEKEFEIY